MKYSQNDELGVQLLDEMLERISGESREDKHPSVTDLIYCLTKTRLDRSSGGQMVTDKTKVYWLLGLGLEKTLIQGRQQVETEGNCEGIWYHVDSIDDGLLEVKSTRLRVSKTTPDTFSEGWIKQTKAYCYAVGVTKVRFIIVHLIEPEVVCWDVEYTPEEIGENWKWLLERKEVWERESVPKPFTYNKDWECRNCVYKMICDGMKVSGYDPER